MPANAASALCLLFPLSHRQNFTEMINRLFGGNKDVGFDIEKTEKVCGTIKFAEKTSYCERDISLSLKSQLQASRVDISVYLSFQH